MFPPHAAPGRARPAGVSRILAARLGEGEAAGGALARGLAERLAARRAGAELAAGRGLEARGVGQALADELRAHLPRGLGVGRQDVEAERRRDAGAAPPAEADRLVRGVGVDAAREARRLESLRDLVERARIAALDADELPRGRKLARGRVPFGAKRLGGGERERHRAVGAARDPLLELAAAARTHLEHGPPEYGASSGPAPLSRQRLREVDLRVAARVAV